MTADLAADKMKDAVNPEEDGAQSADLSTADTQVKREHWQDDTDVYAPQIIERVGDQHCANHHVLLFC